MTGQYFSHILRPPSLDQRLGQESASDIWCWASHLAGLVRCLLASCSCNPHVSGGPRDGCSPNQSHTRWRPCPLSVLTIRGSCIAWPTLSSSSSSAAMARGNWLFFSRKKNKKNNKNEIQRIFLLWRGFWILFKSVSLLWIGLSP